MRFANELTDSAALTELGQRLARQRLARNLTQAELAREAGVDRTALQRLERGESVTLTTAVRLLRALGTLENLEALLPPAEAGPIELVETRGHHRRRARGRRGGPPQRGGGSGGGGGGWKWGDEQ